jgi:hypothetical protein
MTSAAPPLELAPEAQGPPSTSGAGTAEAPSVDGLDRTGRRRLRRAWLAGAVPALLLYAWVLTAGHGNFLQHQFFDDFFDLQARSMLHGRLDVPTDRVGFEGFVTGGRTYVYFGVVPSLLRMPVLVLTDNADGQLTTLSMLAAAVVLAVAAFRLACVIRGMVRGSVPVGPVEQWATAGLAVAVLMAPPFFLTSAAIVYHEAILWGLALSIAAFDAVARWQRDPTGRRLAVASMLITLAILSRLSLALGPLAALALAGALHLRRQWRETVPTETTESPDPAAPVAGAAAGARDRLRRLLPSVAALALAGLVPMTLSMAVNQAKFHQLFGVPPDRQAFAGGMGAGRQAVLEEHSLYVSPEYLPTNMWQYFGPRGFELRRDFPWIDFPRSGPQLLTQGVVYDALDWCSSLPATVPVLCLLAVAGVVWAVRTRRQRDTTRAVSPLLVGALVGSSIVLVFAYIANRYLNDLYPVVLVPGLVGFHAVAQAMAGWRPPIRRAALAGAAGLVAVAVPVNLALALQYQRERGPAVPDDWRAEWLGWRAALPGAPDPIRIGLDDPLPPARDGGVLVVGDCDGLYVGVRDDWLAVERSPAVNVFDLQVDLDDAPIGERVPLATVGQGDQATVLAVMRLSDDTARFDTLEPEDRGLPWLNGVARDLQGEVTIRVTADHRQPANNVFHGTLVLNLVYVPPGEGAAAVTLGRAPDRPGIARAYPGSVTEVPPDMAVCRSVLG